MGGKYKKNIGSEDGLKMEVKVIKWKNEVEERKRRRYRKGD